MVTLQWCSFVLYQPPCIKEYHAQRRMPFPSGICSVSPNWTLPSVTSLMFGIPVSCPQMKTGWHLLNVAVNLTFFHSCHSWERMCGLHRWACVFMQRCHFLQKEENTWEHYQHCGLPLLPLFFLFLMLAFLLQPPSFPLILKGTGTKYSVGE